MPTFVVKQLCREITSSKTTLYLVNDQSAAAGPTIMLLVPSI